VISILISGLSLSAYPAAAEKKVLDEREIQFHLKNMPAELRMEVEALRCVLSPAEQFEFFTLPYDHLRRRWIDAYWRERDPVYTTPENEVLLEHQKRVTAAQSMFFKSSWPMWDQRGEVYIRYGPPTFRQVIPGEVNAGGEIPPGEMWYYHLHDMIVLFEDAFSKGEYTYYLEKVKGPPSPRMSRRGGAIDGPLMVVGPDIVPPAPPMIYFLSQYDRYQKRVGKFFELQKTTPATYRHMFEENRLPLVFSIDCFRGGEWMDRVDVNLDFEADVGCGERTRRTSRYTATSVFWDIDRKEVGRDEQLMEIPVVHGAVDSTRRMPTQFTFTMPPGFYHMAVTMQEEHSSRYASYRTDVACDDFESKFAVSDILFARSIEQIHRDSPFNRGALEVVPHPARLYRRGASVPVYFEIYNMDVNGQNAASYTVEYRIVPHEPPGRGLLDFARDQKAPIDITSSFRSSCSGPHDVVYIKLESSNLWEGIFDFQVKIIDEQTYGTVNRKASFTITE
jgi:GWxTD domain-containing protein